jgi:alkyl hydroperoxide reductase subunit AhpC
MIDSNRTNIWALLEEEVAHTEEFFLVYVPIFVHIRFFEDQEQLRRIETPFIADSQHKVVEEPMELGWLHHVCTILIIDAPNFIDVSL